MTANEKIAELYDQLLGSESARVEAANFAVHKRLDFPAGWQAQGIVDSNDWLVAHLELPENAHILDAGCGVGGTLFALLGEQRSGVGLTLSPKQQAVARAEVTRRGLTDRCQILLQSYDETVEQQFDLIITVEALIHSQDPVATIKGWSKMLKPAGQLIILEDMANEDLSQHPLAEILRQSWCLTTLYTQKDYKDALVQAGLQIQQEEIFTPFVRTRIWPGWFIKLAWNLAGAGKGAAPIFIGGLAQEYLYRHGFLSYQLMRVVKIELQSA